MTSKPCVQISELKGEWALVTGASSGIGREFAAQLAAAGMNVALVARRAEMLEDLSRTLISKHGIKTLIVVLDLTKPTATDELKTRLSQAGIRLRLLCNNAGTGRWGRFEKTSEETYRHILDLNTRVPVSLCHLFFQDLTSFPTSVIINVSSAANYQPIPFMAVYAATKSFIQNFSQALYGEWKDRGVLVQTLVPGPTDTEFDLKAGAYESAVTKRDSAQNVVRASLEGFATGTPVVVAAKGTYTQRFFAGLFPPAMVIREVAKMFKPPEG